MEHGLLIGEVAARSGVSRKAIRLYEARGILPPPRRTPAGYRRYPADVDRAATRGGPVRFSDSELLVHHPADSRPVVALRRAPPRDPRRNAKRDQVEAPRDFAEHFADPRTVDR